MRKNGGKMNYTQRKAQAYVWIDDGMSVLKIIVLFVACAFYPIAYAQRVYEQHHDIIYQDAQGGTSSLGPGQNPIPLPGDNVLFIRGGRLGYGDRLACLNSDLKNSVVLFNTRTKLESVLWDKPLTNDFARREDACIFLQADLSPSRSMLYVVTPWAATSNLLAIINLRTRALIQVGGVIEAYVIHGGPSEGDLIYTRRLWRRYAGDGMEHPFYPFVHAKPDGSQIEIISDEFFTKPGSEQAPILRGYLKRLQGRIYAHGKWIP